MKQISNQIIITSFMQIESDINDKKNSKNRVKVAIRVRPMVSRELISHQRSCVEFPSKHQIIIGSDKGYRFDRVFKQNSSQEQVYEECIKDLILGCFQGYNAAVLAYGQTGSGKTYTMGTNTTTMDCNQQGMIPRVINQIFCQIEKRKNEASFNIRASFLQIYNQQIIDLLDGQKNIKQKNLFIMTRENNISVREEKDGSVTIHGVTQEIVQDSAQMLSLLDRGSIKRTTAATMMNETSSRSHAIFTIFLEQQNINKQDQGFITAKFFFVDLAGSQRLKKTGATGVTLKQGININLGLLQLGNVISALASDKSQPQFITYRNSKLTRILQDSLGGNSNTYMIACISPAETNYQQSINTLKYASKAMNIKNKPIINRDPHSAILLALRQKIQQLQEENIKLKQLLKGEGITYEEAHNFKKSNIEEELNNLKLKHTILERKNEKIFIQLKEEKKRKNQLQIQKYEVQRQKDMMTSYLQQIKNNHPEINFDINGQNFPLIQNYLHKINQLQSQIYQKDKINNQLQIQYTKLRQITERDEQILIKKNETLYRFAKENKELKRDIQDLKKQVYLANGMQYEQDENELSIIQEVIDEEESLQNDESFNQEVKSYNHNEQNIKTQIKRVQTVINQKQSILNNITNEQIQLQYKLISQMKEEYHQKINQLEKQKALLIKQQRSQINLTNANKYSQKIDILQYDLRQFRNKIKEQKVLEQKVTYQNNIIKNLGNDIKTFKVQKIQLNRKLKEDKQNFQKFKQKRTQQLMLAKKQNNKKQIQIRKLTTENRKKNLHVLKKNDELKRIKKLNTTLKLLMKPKKTNIRKDPSKENIVRQQLSIQQEQLQMAVETCLKNMLLAIDRQYDIAKYKKKCQQIDLELDNLIRQQSNLRLKIQRAELQNEQQFYQINQKQHFSAENSIEFKLNLNEIQQRINNLEQNKNFCLKKYEQSLRDQEQKFKYNYQAQIIYNPKYDNINIYRMLMKSFFKALDRLLIQNYDIKMLNEQLNIKNSNLMIEIQELRDNLIKTNIQNQQSLARLREDMMMRMYQGYMQEDVIDNYQINNKIANNTITGATCKINQREKKNFQKKIIELSRINNKLVTDLQVWRRKCGIVQEKYQSLRSLFDKDKFIGRPIRQEQNNINHTNGNSTQKDYRKHLNNNTLSSTNKSINQNSSMLEQLNSMAQKFKNGLRVSKKSLNYIQQSNCDDQDNKSIPQVDRSLSLNKYRWQCVSTIDAHSSPVLAIKNYKHLLISSATRSIKIWDLEANQLNSDITNINLNSFVKSLTVYSDKQLLAASCDKIISLWDLRTSNNELVIRGHKDQIRAMKIVNNYLFSAGKGLATSGSLLVWDLRYLHHSNPMEQKQRGQDIFSLASHNNILYYGTRDHHVRRLNIESMQTLTTFQPPHMDTVTGLTICKGHLISGSKDKNLRLWSLDNSIYNLKSTTHAFNDYINTVQSDNYHPLFYSGDRTGQVKVGTIIKEKFEFLGQISHTQSVNSICSLEFTKGLTATASTDKTIKLWQPNSQTFHQIDNNLC